MENSSPVLSKSQDDLVALVRQSQEGSQEAAQLLFDRCRGPLLAVIRRVICPPLRRLYDSDDFLADTFAEIFARHFTDEVLQSPARLWPYLKRIAENKVCDAERKHLGSQRHNIRREVSLDELKSEECLWSTDLGPDEVLILNEVVEERLDDLIVQLPSMLQRIVRLLRQGNNGLQISHRLGVEPKRVYRAMAWLKRKIADL